MTRLIRTVRGALLALVLLPLSAAAQVHLPAVFGDHMVAQCERPFRVWGVAPPGEALTVTLWLSTGGRSTAWIREAEAGADGRWQVEVEAQPPGGPYRLTVGTPAGVARTIEDLWFGEVWVCSGQSNMEWPLSQSQDGEAEIAAAATSRVRLLRVPRRASDEPTTDFEAAWQPCTPESAADFSAVGYHFGRALEARLGRPIGLIEAAWGGTPAEAWTPRAFLEDDDALRPILEREPRGPSWAPAVLYNGMLAPLARLELAGAIWYQGESNAERAEQYRMLFPTMIRAWREAFGREDLPFLFVQLANFKARQPEPGESDWAELREAQALALSLPRTGMAVTIDVGAADDIHPRDKRTVGERLALCARRIVYGEEDLVASGPVFRAMRVDGDRVEVELDHAAGLSTRDRRAPTGFALAGEDRVFHWARASLEGGRLVLSSDAVPHPVAVRFAWADNPEHNLINGAGLPAAPFRSDDWPGTTSGRR